MIVGIDPGQGGALAFLKDGKVEALYDMPVMARVHGKGKEVNAYMLCSIFMSHCPGRAVVEAVSAMPGQGVSSMFRFGESLGILKGVLGTLQIPYIMMTPQKWKKVAGLIKKDKDVSRTLAIQQFPSISDQLSLKKHVGRSDAIWIAKSIL